MTVAERIENLRRYRGWSKRELARRTALSYQQICKLIAGERTRLEADTIIALARAFEISTDQVLGLQYCPHAHCFPEPFPSGGTPEQRADSPPRLRRGVVQTEPVPQTGPYTASVAVVTPSPPGTPQGAL